MAAAQSLRATLPRLTLPPDDPVGNDERKRNEDGVVPHFFVGYPNKLASGENRSRRDPREINRTDDRRSLARWAISALKISSLERR